MPELYYKSTLDDVYDRFRSMEPDEQQLYIARSPLLTLMSLRPEVIPFPHTRYTDDHLLALMELRLYPTGPGPTPLVFVDESGDFEYVLLGETYADALSERAYLGHDMILVNPDAPLPSSLAVGDHWDPRPLPNQWKVVYNLGIHQPPRHGKSLLITEAMPVCFMANYPTAAVIAATYNANFAEEWGQNLKDLARDNPERFPWGSDGLPLVPPLSSSVEGTKFRPGKDQGEINFKGIGGSITGTGFNLGIIDDPFKGESDSHSDKQRSNKSKWYQSVFSNRRTRKLGMPPPLHVMMFARWHVRDLAGEFIYDKRNNPRPDWCAIRLPAIAEENDPLGRKPGQALCPALTPLKDLKREQSVNRAWFPALYQGRPVNRKGNMFTRTVNGPDGPEYPHWNFETGQSIDDAAEAKYIVGPHINGSKARIALRGEDTVAYATVDTAGTRSTQSDYTVVSFWIYSRKTDTLVLLNSQRARMETNQLLDWIIKQVREFQTQFNLQLEFCGVEAKTFGISLIGEFQRRLPSFPITKLSVKADKVTRAVGYVEGVKSQKVWFPELHLFDWVVEWEDEHANFPRGSHDDMVDTGSLAYTRSRIYALAIDEMVVDTEDPGDAEVPPDPEDCPVRRGWKSLARQNPARFTADGAINKPGRRRAPRRWPAS